MNRAALLLVCACIGVGASGVSIARAADEPALNFRGAGKTREQLNAMQLKPFDTGLWAHLTNWNGTAPKPEDLTGKVVLVVTWANWLKLSYPAMRTAQGLHEKYKDQGLVVLGVHNPRGVESAAENAKSLGVTFPFAEDKDGKFRAGVKADQDPNIYFIDRSGNLRYAQVENLSMGAAAEALLKETAEQAADYPKKLVRDRAAQDKAKRRTQDISGPLPGEEPTVEFPEPEEDAYKNAKWPYMVGKVEKDPIFDKIKHEAPKIQNWPEEDWAPSTPKRAGKIIVLYFFDPKEVEMLNAIPIMNRLQDEYKRDVLVVGSMYKTGSNAFSGNNGGANEEDQKITERNKEFVATILRTRSVNHFLNSHVLRAENWELAGGGMVPRLSATQDEAGFAVIVSSDLRVRWVGSPYDPDLRTGIDKLIAVDPAVKARRKAEDAKKK